MSHRRSRYQQSGQGRFKTRLMIIMGGLTVLATALVIRFSGGDEAADAANGNVRQASAAVPASQQSPQVAPAAPGGPNEVVAIVNGQQITHGLLSQECLKHYGGKVLESLTNKYIIALRCREANITITEEEVNQEIDRVARRFGIPVDQWMVMLERERNIKPEQYASEIIWPTLALRRLAAGQIQVSDDDVAKALDRQFGPQVHVRLIITRDGQKAQKIHEQLAVNPNLFPKLAREHSSDVNSASAGGLIQPIRRHSGDAAIEAAAFALQPGQISEILTVGDRFAILKCEKQIPGQNPTMQQREQAATLVRNNLRDRRLRDASGELFKKLQDEAEIVNVFNDPVKREQMAGVAATVNGHQISIEELARECVARHGVEVLEGQVNRALLKGALADKNLVISEQDIWAEVGRAALAAGVVTGSGKPHLEEWIKVITREQDITQQIYIDDLVWPTVALKSLVADQVEVTAEDMQKAFDANYGERVRCRAIVMSNQRRAQEVWDMARREPTVEHFAKLAEQYSIDPSGKALGGEVPPIQQHGGQPALERQAFALQPGEISGVIQMAGGQQGQDHFVILFCEGRTKPKVIELHEVQDELHTDLVEKKFRLVMASHFQQLRESSHIKNYLNPSASNTPKQQASAASGGGRFAPQKPATR